jgi:hypothetical protein
MRLEYGSGQARAVRSTLLGVRARALLGDRMRLGLWAVFALAACTYVWSAAVASPLTLYGARFTAYNELADALLHLHLWVAHVPVHPPGHEPFDPRLRPALIARYADYSLDGHYLYLPWGPAPVVVLLLPLHLLGFEPSGSVIMLPFALAGLGFALAALRVILRRIGGVPTWMAVLCGLVLAYCSVVLFLLQFPTVYYEAIAGGYCFAMAGIWLAVSAVGERRTSRWRLGAMSLCFGLATASRPTLGVTALVLLAVYLALRPAPASKHARSIAALVLPMAVCVALLGAYNEARFGSPLQYGVEYELNENYHQARWGEIDYVPVGLWSYLVTLPHPEVLPPFLYLTYPQVSYPLGLPAHYKTYSEETGGLLSMTPIVLFLGALPWLWRRRTPAPLGSLAGLLAAMALAGAIVLLFLCYDFFATTQRYEVDYTSLLLFGALAAWVALSRTLGGRRRRLVRIVGGVLATWSCLIGVAAGCYYGLRKDSGTWQTATELTEPASTAIAAAAGQPVLAELAASHVVYFGPRGYFDLGTRITGIWLGADEQADLTVVSPATRAASLLAQVFAGPAAPAGGRMALRIAGPGAGSRVYELPGGGTEVALLVHLRRGLNDLVLTPASAPAGGAAALQPMMYLTGLHLGAAAAR